MLAQQLFMFVTAVPVQIPSGEARPVAGTNIEAEGTLRSAAEARKTGRTGKTLRGARRQTILISVLESLRQQLATSTLSSVINEILHWSHAGLSCFAKRLAKLQLAPSNKPTLELVFPDPSGYGQDYL